MKKFELVSNIKKLRKSRFTYKRIVKILHISEKRVFKLRKFAILLKDFKGKQRQEIFNIISDDALEYLIYLRKSSREKYYYVIRRMVEEFEKGKKKFTRKDVIALSYEFEKKEKIEVIA